MCQKSFCTPTSYDRKFQKQEVYQKNKFLKTEPATSVSAVIEEIGYFTTF